MHTYKSVKSMMKNIDKEIAQEKKTRPFWYFFSRLYYRIGVLKDDVILGTKSFFQRGKRGWSNSDTWGFCYYLAKTISGGIQHLKKNLNGYPCELTEGQWIDILNKISNTFDVAKKIDGSDLYYFKNKRQRNKWQKSLEVLNKDHKTNIKCMTDIEIKEYEEGWDLFRTHFFSLWD